jgi:hypothetical protein
LPEEQLLKAPVFVQVGASQHIAAVHGKLVQNVQPGLRFLFTGSLKHAVEPVDHAPHVGGSQHVAASQVPDGHSVARATSCLFIASPLQSKPVPLSSPPHVGIWQHSEAEHGLSAHTVVVVSTNDMVAPCSFTHRSAAVKYVHALLTLSASSFTAIHAVSSSFRAAPVTATQFALSVGSDTAAASVHVAP